MREITFTILKPAKLLDFLNSFYLSKTNIYKLNTSKSLSVNSEIVDINYILKKGDFLDINTDCFQTNQVIPWNHDIKVIYEDLDLIVVNKPSGILVHPDGNSNKTLINAIKSYYNKNNKDDEVRVVHRLDVETSGIMVFAKNILSHSFLSKQMEDKDFEKIYVAIVDGKLDKESGIIDLPIAKDRHNNNKYIVNENGKYALTHYKILKKLNNKTLIEINLETGRTHQIRVHFSTISHPIIGDNIYGNNSNNSRLMLHAKSISFIHPRTRKRIKFESKLPKEFNQ